MDVGHLIHSYGYLALAVGTLLEGETVLVAAGLAARDGYLDPLAVVLVAALCGFAGDQLWFAVGRNSGAWLRVRLPRLASAAERLNRLVCRFDLLAVAAVRFLYGLRIAGPLIIGSGTMHWRRFAWLNLLGAILWAIVIGGAGYASAGVIDRTIGASPRYQLELLGGVLGLLGLVHVVRRLRVAAGKRHVSGARSILNFGDPNGSGRTDGGRPWQMGTLGFQRLKVVALAATDLARARRFYGETLALAPAFEGARQVGYSMGNVIVMLKSAPDGWYARPSDQLNPRITLATDHAPDTERELDARGVTIADPVQAYADEGFYVGSFLDSEGNKLWFCSPIESGPA